jgi:hypothetical protein
MQVVEDLSERNRNSNLQLVHVSGFLQNYLLTDSVDNFVYKTPKCERVREFQGLEHGLLKK